MTMKLTAAMATIALLAAGSFAGPALADDAGSCSFVQKNMFAGPYKVCEMPVDAAACAVIGKSNDNKDAVHTKEACPMTGVVGTCDKGTTKLLYYDGDASELDTGCGFQKGVWMKP